MTETQFAFLFSAGLVFVISLRGVIKFALAQEKERREAVDTALAAVGKKRPDSKPRRGHLIPVNKGYRSWLMYRFLNATGLDGLSRFIWRRRRNAWFIRGFFTRFK